MGLWGTGGAQGVKKKFNYGHVAYQINGNDKQNRMQVTFSSWGQTGDLGARSNIINMSMSKIFILNSLCVFSQIKDRKHIEQIFILLPGSCPRVLGGVKNFSVCICDGAPSTARSS